jgi:chemotaxis protein MotB
MIHRSKPSSSRERWLISYADMLTLLFAIFVFLYSFSKASQSNQEDMMHQLSSSMRVAFKAPFEEIPQEKRVAPQEAGVGVFDYFKGNKLRPALVDTFPSENGVDDVIEKDAKLVQKRLQERMYGPQHIASKGDQGQERVVSVVRNKKGFQLRLAGRFFFKDASYQLDKNALVELSEVVKVVKELGRPVLIEAHTDDTIHAKSKLGKWEVSALRAASVIDYMINVHGFPKSRISTAAYADIRPLTSDKSANGNNLNQRIEIQIKYEEPDFAKL